MIQILCQLNSDHHNLQEILNHDEVLTIPEIIAFGFVGYEMTR